MARIDEASLKARVERVWLLLRRHPDGLTEAEIAEMLGFEQRTVHNYLKDHLGGQVRKEGKHWLADPRQAITLRRYDLEPEEAMVLYLAARLFVKQSDKRNETAETVLAKLAEILSTDAGLGYDLHKAALELAQRPYAPGYQDVFRTVTRAYLYRRKLKLVYQPYRGEPFTTTFAPFLLEPSAIGFATYAVGDSSLVGGLRTYKLERILSAEILNEEYFIPPDFPGLALLRNAWSIYYGETTIQVMLRFHPDVAQRILETHWHPSQKPVESDPNHPGYVLLCFEVADTTDLKPWIRGWGASCEVLEPAELRAEMMGEARRIAEVYGWHMRRNPQEYEDDPLDLSNILNDLFG